MKKIYLTLILGIMFLSLASAGTINVTLNSPPDESVQYTSPTIFNATISTDASSIVNISLWDNSTGVWKLNETNNPSYQSTDYLIAGQLGTYGTYSATAYGGGKVLIGSYDIQIQNVTLYTGNTATKVYIEWENHTVRYTATVSGMVANFGGVTLESGQNFYITSGKDGATYTLPYRVYSTGMYSRGGTYFNLTTGYYGSEAVNTHYGITNIYANILVPSFSKTILDYMEWNIQACDSDGDCGFAINNFTVSPDMTEPNITITYPTTTINYGKSGNSLDLNWTVTDDGTLDSCWYDYNGTNTTLTCGNNHTTFNLSSDSSLIFYANDSFNNVASKLVNLDFRIFENSRTLNTSSYETKSETFSINVTANSSLTNVQLDYNGTLYSTTKSGTVYSKTLDIPIGILNNSLRWKFTYAGEIIYSDNSSQNVEILNFSLCDAGLTDDFLNISFKDEDDLSTINASISSSTFTYYLGSGLVNKTYTYSNSIDTFNYRFCAIPTTETLKVKPYIQFKQGADYPQRIWDTVVQSYTSTVTSKILYLLGVADGIYVTYQVLDGTGDQLSGVEVTADRTIGGEDVEVANGQSDPAGLVTFWLNPDFVHSLDFSKTGYETFNLNHFPTQSSYTVTMGTSSSTTIVDYLLGIYYEISPSLGLTLNSNQNYHFNFTLNSTNYDVTSFGFTLYGDDTVIGGNLSSTINSTIWNLINVSNYSQISMDYYYIINGTTTSSENFVWTVFNNEDTSWSIKQFFTDLSTYADDGIFGLDQAALNFIIFVIIFVIVGIVSYRFRITSPAAVSGMIFGLVFLFDVALGLIDIGVGVDHFPTIFIGLIMIALIVREAR